MKLNDPLKRALTATLLAAWLAVTLVAASLPLPSPDEVNSITARDLKRHLSFLASDELGGRDTLSQGNRIAARYLASQLESYGFRGGAGDGSFFQKVPLSYRSVEAAASKVTFTTSGQTTEFNYGDGFVSAPPVDADISGDLVFVGYGISSPQNKHDDYAGLDVKGKIVVLIAEDMPDALKRVAIIDEEKGERAAAAHGAVGAINILPAPMIVEWQQMKAYLSSPDQLGLPPHLTPAGKPFPIIAAGPPLIKAIAGAMGKTSSYLQPAGKPAPPMPVPAKAGLRVAASVKEAPPAQNVIGVLEGADPKLKDEYVVFSAHYDHLKTDNGEVYNGADDDGSGTVAVLEIAQAFTVGPRPPRSILIIFHTGEEIGLFGSEYNTDYEPAIPLAKLVTDLNIDMIGRSKPDGDTDPRDRELADKDTLYVIGSDKLSSELHKLSEATDNETAHLKFDYRYNDERHPERLYYRSDHYNYARHGIPVIFYFTGLHRDYHRPTDDVDKIDFEKMERVTRMIFATGWRVANLDHRLVVDKVAASAHAQ
jgi:Peptidase family M28